MTKQYSKPQRKLMTARNGMADAAVLAGDQVDLAVIFTTFFTPMMHQFLESLGKYFLFPIAAAAHVFRTILAWRQAWIDKKQRSLVTAAVETVATAGIVAAVVGGLVASSMFALATPIIFTSMLLGKTLFHAGSAVYYAGKASGQEDAAKKQKYKQMAIQNGISAAAGLVATVAVGAVFLFGKFAVAGLGLAAAVIGVTLAVVKGYRMHKAEQAAKAALREAVEPLESSTEKLIAEFENVPGNEIKQQVGWVERSETQHFSEEPSINQPATLFHGSQSNVQPELGKTLTYRPL